MIEFSLIHITNQQRMPIVEVRYNIYYIFNPIC